MTKFEKYLDAVIEEALEELDEAEIKFVKGSKLTPEQQKEVKNKFVNRYTGNNKPEWTKETWKDNKPYPLHFKDDNDWLENTLFGITTTGKLHSGSKYCNSSPTYPNNPELRKTVKKSEELDEGIRKVIIKKDEAGDYKIPYAYPAKSKSDDGFAYCDSKEDAIGTAKSMYKKIDDVIIKIGGKVILHKEAGEIIV